MVVFFLPNKPPEPSNKKEKSSLIKNKDFLYSVLIFFLIALVQFGFRILIALWVAVDSSDKGLGWTDETNPGLMNSGSGLFIAFAPIFLTPFLSNQFGIRKTCMILSGVSIPIVLCISWAYLLNGIELWIVLILLNGCWNAFITILVSFISIAISNSVESNIVGIAVGSSQSIAALSRAVASTGVAYIFGWSLGWNFFFPFDSHFIFILIAFVLVATITITFFFLNESIEKRKKKPEEIPLIDKEPVNKGL